MDEQRYQYRTGQTEPKKSHGGLIALLLILAIFFCGVFSALSLLNIHLSLLANHPDPQRVQLSFSPEQTDTTDGLPALYDDTAPSVTVGGMVCQTLSVPCQQLYSLPAGLYIAQVHTDSPAHKQGIRPGDVLTGFNGTAVTQLDTLQQLLDAPTPVQLTVYRNGQYHTLSLPYEKTQEG